MEPSSASTQSSQSSGSSIQGIIATAKAVITDPTTFFRGMPRSGGFVDPVIFIVATSIASVLVAVVLSIFGSNAAAMFGGLVVGFVLGPLVTVLFSFFWAAVFFVIWRFLGSGQPYETSFRCFAYMTAISPIAMLLNVVPYLGGIAVLVWAYFLIIAASDEVHAVPRQTARVAFGVVTILFALMSISSQLAARRMQKHAGVLNEKLDGIEDMSPEEAGKAVGDFMKGLQGAVEEKEPRPGE